MIYVHVVNGVVDGLFSSIEQHAGLEFVVVNHDAKEHQTHLYSDSEITQTVTVAEGEILYDSHIKLDPI